LRQRIPEALLEHDKSCAHFIKRRHTLAAYLVGLPGRRNLPKQLFARLVALNGRQIGPVAQRQNPGDAIVFLYQRAARDLGGMRCKHELDAQRFDGPPQRVSRDAFVLEPLKRLGARPALRPPSRVPRMISSAADPVVLLGDIGEVEKMGERPGDRSRRGDRHLAKKLGDVVEIGIVARPAGALGRLAHAFHALEQRLALMVAERQPEQLAQEPHVIPQRLVGIGRHRRIVTQSRFLHSDPEEPKA
jgi:hypothetical protein